MEYNQREKFPLRLLLRRRLFYGNCIRRHLKWSNDSRSAARAGATEHSITERERMAGMVWWWICQRTAYRTFHSFAVIKFIIEDAFFAAFRISLLSAARFSCWHFMWIDRPEKGRKKEAARKGARGKEWRRAKRKKCSPIGTIYLIWASFIDTEKTVRSSCKLKWVLLLLVGCGEQRIT